MPPTKAPNPTSTEYPEVPDSVAWQPIPIYNRPPQPASTPVPKGSPKVAIAYALMILLGTGAVGLTMYRAGISAGASESATEIATLESQAAAQNQQIEVFCKAAGH